VLALQASTNMAWDGDVRDGDGAEVAVADGETQFSGPCTLLAFPWDHDKPGGPDREEQDRDEQAPASSPPTALP
jgi:hypothetical protein